MMLTTTTTTVFYFSVWVVLFPVLVSKIAAQPSCSMGQGTVECDSTSTCADNIISLCDDVVCDGRSVCDNAVFNQSFVEFMNNAGECSGCEFWYSAIITTGTSFDNIFDPIFSFCTCCDDDGTGICPANVPSCTEDPVAFCSQEELLRTCKDWGNPACTNADVPSSANEVADATTCSVGVDTVYCTDTSSCDGLSFSGCKTLCVGTDSCKDASFYNSSVVGCYDPTNSNWNTMCDGTKFNGSFVDLRGEDCPYCEFWFSAITTNGAFDNIFDPVFSFCTCCDDTTGGGNCPDDLPTCTQDVELFCSQEEIFRTCKDWGNPVCNDVDVPSANEVADATTCSLGLDTILCADSSSCEGLSFSGCKTLCFGDDSCKDASFYNASVVGCYDPRKSWGTKCDGTIFNRSYVDLRNEDCPSCQFWFSAVKTNGPFDGIFDPVFSFCTCCDDTSGNGNCPPNLPSCTADPVMFCSHEEYFRTCKDWGNPACSDVDVPSALNEVANSTTCSAGVDTLLCTDSTSSCEGLRFGGCKALCLSSDSCKDTVFSDASVVGCYNAYNSYSDMCDGTTFNRSFVDLRGEECPSCQFWFSAITIDGPFDSIFDPVFGFCSCCDDTSGGGNCPMGMPSCVDDPQSFCSLKIIGQTCKDWGNPVCADVEITAVEAFTSDATCSLPADDYACLDSACLFSESEVTGCSIECYGVDSCADIVFEESAVACLGRSTCSASKFNHSLVDCSNSYCEEADFFTSSVECGSNPSNCDYIALALCTCCDGESCPPTATSCKEAENDDASKFLFCSSTAFGRTCKDWGHPLCEDIDVASLPPLKPDCSLSEEVKLCIEGDDGCFNLNADSCAVFCFGRACNSATFTDSIVTCYDRVTVGWATNTEGDACYDATFDRSVVSCINTCERATFTNSQVRCTVPGCSFASFSECTCCDGEGCPQSVPTCQGNIDAICNQVVGDETCACRGFPGCSDEQLASCDISVAATLAPTLMPVLSIPASTTPAPRSGMETTIMPVAAASPSTPFPVAIETVVDRPPTEMAPVNPTTLNTNTPVTETSNGNPAPAPEVPTTTGAIIENSASAALQNLGACFLSGIVLIAAFFVVVLK